MFGLFDKNDAQDAKILFGSSEEEREAKIEIKNPFTGKVVSTYPLCDAHDAKRALDVAKHAAHLAAKSPLHQRIAWLEEVADRIEAQRDRFAEAITDEVGKPIAFSRIEVVRCVETIRLTAQALTQMHGETIPTDATPSGRQATAFWWRVPAGVVVAARRRL